MGLGRGGGGALTGNTGRGKQRSLNRQGRYLGGEEPGRSGQMRWRPGAGESPSARWPKLLSPTSDLRKPAEVPARTLSCTRASPARESITKTPRNITRASPRLPRTLALGNLRNPPGSSPLSPSTLHRFTRSCPCQMHHPTALNTLGGCHAISRFSSLVPEPFWQARQRQHFL